MISKRLDSLFNPKTIAIIGASDRASSWSKEIYANLKGLGFQGSIFPINPRRSTVWDQPAYPSLSETPVPAELAIIAIPAVAAVEAVKACGEAGVPGVMVVSSGFRDGGPDGAELQVQLAAAAVEADITLIGPNVEGFINYPGRVAAYGAEMPPTAKAGSISMFSQSGTAAWAFTQMAGDRGVGIRVVSGVGVEATLGIGELLEWAASDPETTVAACYIETIRDIGALARGLRCDGSRRQAGRHLLPARCGRSGESRGDRPHRRTPRRHHLARCGASPARRHRRLRSGRAVRNRPAVGERAGPGAARESSRPPCSPVANCTLFADALNDARVPLEKFSAATMSKLSEILPDFSEPRNPLDVTGQAIFDTEIYCGAIDTLAADPEVGMIAIDVAPSRERPDDSDLTTILAHAGKVQRESGKPVISVLATPLSYTGRTVEPIIKNSVAVLHGHGPAATAIAGLYEISRERLPIAERHAAKPRVSVAPGVLDEVQAAEIFTQYGIERPREAVVNNPKQAAEAARELDCRIVVKLVCAEVPHKAREGLVKLSLDSPVEVEIAAQKVQDRAREMGVDATRLLVQEQLAAGPEFLIGVTVDPVYGPAMTVRTGGGGVSGETVFNLLPLRQGEAASIASSAAADASIELTNSESKQLIDVVERFAWLR